MSEDQKRGLHRKYDVRRVNDPTGKHDGCWYFVLDPQHDPHAAAALRSYAASVASSNPQLAAELLHWADTDAR